MSLEKILSHATLYRWYTLASTSDLSNDQLAEELASTIGMLTGMRPDDFGVPEPDEDQGDLFGAGPVFDEMHSPLDPEDEHRADEGTRPSPHPDDQFWAEEERFYDKNGVEVDAHATREQMSKHSMPKPPDQEQYSHPYVQGLRERIYELERHLAEEQVSADVAHRTIKQVTNELGKEEGYSLVQTAARTMARLSDVEDALDTIGSWCKAYPIAVFPEPDWPSVAMKLGNNLMTRVSAANMRHVVDGVQRIITECEKNHTE